MSDEILDPTGVPIPPNEPNNPGKENLRRKTAEWIGRNPQIYALFVEFAREALKLRFHFGAKLITERVRWEAKVRWGEDERDGKYKICNNYVAYIARRLCQDVPGVEHLMRFRQTRY